MIFLSLKISNFFMFQNTEVDFTYPKKNMDSTVKNEYLEKYPNIKFKRVCLLMGANASGKTSLGRAMCMVTNYLYGRETIEPESDICNKDEEAYFEVIYVTPDNGKVHRTKARFKKDDGLVYEEYSCNQLYSSKSLKKTLSDLNNSKPNFVFDISDASSRHGIENIGFRSALTVIHDRPMDEFETVWNYLFNNWGANSNDNFMPYDIDFLGDILQAFDPSIESVKSIEDAKETFIVKFKNGDPVVIQEGKGEKMDRLSRGTLEAIEVANFISRISLLGSGTYFLDEKMAYSHSEMEMAIIDLMIHKLNNQSQLFITTHNHDVLEMNLPSHSYVFLRKDEFISVSQPEKLGYTKNDRSLLGYVKNDVFNTIPDTSKVYDLMN